jgi:hypothetical protein
MLVESWIGVAMAFETEGVEAGLNPKFEIGTAAAVAIDAGIHAAPVRKIVVAGKAIDGDVFRMREIQRHAHRARRARISRVRVYGFAK